MKFLMLNIHQDINAKLKKIGMYSYRALTYEYSVWPQSASMQDRAALNAQLMDDERLR